jgi:uncharacterized membrane protein YuzA (DUF378 family)
VTVLKTIHMIAFGLLVIGGLNWLLVGLLHKDLFTLLGMSMTSIVPTVVYILVGLSAILEAVTHGKNCRMCGSSTVAPTTPAM